MIYKIKDYLITNYMDDSGYLGLTRNPPPGYGEANSTLYSSQAYILFHKLGVLDPDDISRFRGNVDKVTVSLGRDICRGLYHRHPNLTNLLEAHDNYIGIAACANLLGLDDICQDICNWGEDHKIYIPSYHLRKITWFPLHYFLSMIKCYWYNNLDPEKFRIEALRQGSHTAFFDYCANREVSSLNKLWLAGSIITAMFSKGTSTKILSWIMLEVLKNKSSFWKAIHYSFNKVIDIKKVTKEYFGDSPYTHLYEVLGE